MDEVARTGQPVVITKHGKPVTQLGPVPAEPESMFGYMKNTVAIKGDFVAPTGEPWSPDSGANDPLVSTANKKARGRIQLKVPLRSWVERALSVPGIRLAHN